MTFVLQLHFVKMKLNLKQEKKNAKKAVLRFDYLLYFVFLTPSYWTAFSSKLDLLVSIPPLAHVTVIWQ